SSAARLSRWACDRALASRIAALGRRPTASSVAGVNVRGRPAEEEARAFLDRWYAAPLWGDVRQRRPSAYSAMIDRRLSNLGFDPSHRGCDDRSGAPREVIKSDGHDGRKAVFINNSSTGLRRDSGLSNGRGEGNSSEAALRTGSGRGLSSESGDRDGKKDREGMCLVPTGRDGGAGGNRNLIARELARSCLALSVARQANLWPLLRQLSDKKNTDKMGGGGGAGENSVLPVVYVAGELDPRYGGRCGEVCGSGTSGSGGGVHCEPRVGSASAANGTTPPPPFPSEQGGAAGGGGCGADLS
ncbi:unnamed protein product, partial [Ectocarpus sp. 12 AP-2014]